MRSKRSNYSGPLTAPCCACGCETKAAPPAEATAPARYGPSVRALAAYLAVGGFPAHVFHHERECPRDRRRRPRVPPPRSCPGRGPGPVLEGLRVTEPALRELHPEPRLGGHEPHRRGAHRLGADDLPRRRAQGGRTQDAPLPAGLRLDYAAAWYSWMIPPAPRDSRCR